MASIEEFFSASYNGINPNFVIEGEIEHSEVDEPFNSLFSICRNIINRGAEIKPSNGLEKYSVLEGTGMLYTECVRTPRWTERTILGGSKNTAFEFYKNELRSLMESIFPEHSDLLYNSFIPECPVHRISTAVGQNTKTRMDFYSPIFKFDIEIDGIQHEKGEQSLKDDERNRIMTESGVSCFRIKTSTYGSNVVSLRQYMIASKEMINRMLDNCFVKLDVLDEDDISLMYAIRFQLLLIVLLQSGAISLSDDTWPFNIRASEKCDSEVFELAYGDLTELIKDVSTIMGISIPSIPKLVIDDPSAQAIDVDIEVDEYYGEYDGNGIWIRNDYFLYDADADRERDRYYAGIYQRYKNHYTVSNGNFHYDLNGDDPIIHEAMKRILRRCFHFDDFINRQKDIIVSCLNGHGTVGVMPTSAGKSLCYQFCALLLPGRTLTISPLKALMEDQYNNLIDYGISNVSYLNADSKLTKTNTILKNRALISMVAPERFFNESFTTFLSKHGSDFKLIVIDEVHCLSEWGHDFRTSYLCLMYSFEKYFSKDVCLVGLTATASPNVAEDVINEFRHLKDDSVLIQSDSLARDNLVLHSIYLDGDIYGWLEDYISKTKKLTDTKIVVFTKTKSNRDKEGCKDLLVKVDKDLEDNSLAGYYCSDDDTPNLTNSQKMARFKNGDIRLLFATKAFGMGVNIPDIRATIHYGLPSSVESLYQEFGRAGRDCKKSDCYIVFNREYDYNISLLAKKEVTIGELKKRTWRELDTNMYLFETSNIDVDEELAIIENVYAFIQELLSVGKDSFQIREYAARLDDCFPKRNKGGYLVPHNNKDAQGTVEKALYRLLTLGYIEMWSTVYSEDITNPTIDSLKLKGISSDIAIERLERYIRKYENDYQFKGRKQRPDIIRALLEWSFNNFVRSRLESMRLVYSYCMDEKNRADGKNLMKAITEFLTIDNDLYKVHEQTDVENWFRYIHKNTPDVRVHKIDRFYESSYRSPGISFISAITYLQLGVEKEICVQRMEDALIKIKEFRDDEIDSMIVQSFELSYSEESKELLSNMFIKALPHKLNLIYKRSNSTTAEYCLLDNYNKRLARIGGVINDRC